MKVNGWKLLCHELFYELLNKCIEEVNRTKLKRPEDYKSTPQYQLLAFLRKIIFEEIPKDPHHRRYNLKGNLKKFKRRDSARLRRRIFFQYFSKSNEINYLWFNKDNLRKAGDKNDPYNVFLKLVKRGVFDNPNNYEMDNQSKALEDTLI